jgi:hypothetical protein
MRASSTSRTPSHERRRARRRSGTGWLLALALIALAGGAGTLAFGVPQIRAADTSGPTATATPTGSAPASPTRTPAASPSTEAPPVYRLPGKPPERGEDSFTIGTTRGAIAGRSGTLRRYRIAVEVGSKEDVEEFGAFVDRTLSDPRSWTAGGQVRLQRVGRGEDYDFTVYLATRYTAHEMCARGGTNNNINGVSYTSCRAVGQVIVNLDRWRLSVDHFVEAKIPLSLYREYVVNHETGHELGRRHERCPGDGEVAPVMMQQTLFLDGCEANTWPYVKGRLYRGPLL